MAASRPVRVGMLPSVCVDDHGKVIPTPSAINQIAKQNAPPRTAQEAARLFNLAVSQTLLDAWYGEPAEYDRPQGRVLSWPRAAEIAKELERIAEASASAKK